MFARHMFIERGSLPDTPKSGMRGDQAVAVIDRYALRRVSDLHLLFEIFVIQKTPLSLTQYKIAFFSKSVRINPVFAVRMLSVMVSE